MGKSGYRSGELQKAIYKIYTFLYGEDYVNKYVAVPGGSEHQTGLALDIGNRSNSFISSNEAEWLAENAYKYGFIIRYPEGKEKITGVNYEPWNIRYVGEEIAEEIYGSGMTLEEYLLCPGL